MKNLRDAKKVENEICEIMNSKQDIYFGESYSFEYNSNVVESYLKIDIDFDDNKNNRIINVSIDMKNNSMSNKKRNNIKVLFFSFDNLYNEEGIKFEFDNIDKMLDYLKNL